jgi:hypothetical protein
MGDSISIDLVIFRTHCLVYETHLRHYLLTRFACLGLASAESYASAFILSQTEYWASLVLALFYG